MVKLEGRMEPVMSISLQMPSDDNAESGITSV